MRYLANILWGHRIPLVMNICDTVAENDFPCFAPGVDGEQVLRLFQTSHRLGMDNAVYLYNPLNMDSTIVETFTATMASKMTIRTIQVRGASISNATAHEIIDSRVPTIIMSHGNTASAYPLLRALAGEERAKYLNFLVTFGQSYAHEVLNATFVGDENPIFDVAVHFNTDLQSAFITRAFAEGWTPIAAKTKFPALVGTTCYYFYYLLKMWAYGFQQLVAGTPPELIASSLDYRPLINRRVYLSNTTHNLILNAQVQDVLGVPYLFRIYSVAKPNFTEFQRVRQWGLSCRRFIDWADGTGVITNATYADGLSTPPPAVVPFPTKNLETSALRTAGFAVGGILIGLNLILLGMLVIWKGHKSVKSVSWVFMGTTVVGSILLAVTLFLSTTTPTYAACNTVPVLITTGLHLIVVSIAVKAIRLSIIFHNKRSRRIKLKDEKLAGIVLSLFILDIILLAVWLSLDPMKPVYVEENQWQVLRCHSGSQIPWALFAYGLAKLIVALKYTYSTRGVYSEYNETKAVRAKKTLVEHRLEGHLILLTIALATTSFGTSITVVGSRLVYTLFEITGKTSQMQSMSSNRREWMAKLQQHGGGGQSGDPETGSQAIIVVESSAFECAIRKRSLFTPVSRWYSCYATLSRNNPEPNLNVTFWDNVGEKLKLVRSINMTAQEVGRVVSDGDCQVKLDSSRGNFDISFVSETAVAAFIEVFNKFMPKPVVSGSGKRDSTVS
ncbi:hypothetical protein HK102_013222 [Quaeritorhiza haematococci]|nr:hypothetical protein HK102_013222 [Quaeritorhiza haematococci]